MVKKALTRDNKPIIELKVSCKINKRVKYTSKKLKIDNEKILKTVKFLKVQNLLQVKKMKSLFYHNIYVYVSLKLPIKEKIKKTQIKLCSSLITCKNKLKICIVTDNKTDELEIKILETLTKKDEFKGLDLKSLIEVIDFKSFAKLIKSQNDVNNLNFFYHQFIIENKFFGRLKSLLGKDLFNLDIILFNNISKDLERESKLIFSSLNCSKVSNIYNNKLFKIKVSNCSETLSNIYKNVKLNLYRTVAFLLALSEKHNK